MNNSGLIYTNAKAFNEGLAAVKIEDKYGYINDIILLLNRNLKKQKKFSNGLAPVKYMNGKWGCINKDNEIIIEPKYDMINEFSEGIAIYYDSNTNKYGGMDLNGNIVISPQYIWVEDIKNGLAVVILPNKKYGMIDKNDHWFIEPKYRYLSNFSEELAVANLNGEYVGFIDINEFFVIDPKYYFANDFNNKRSKVTIENTKGYIDKKGSWIFL